MSSGAIYHFLSSLEMQGPTLPQQHRYWPGSQFPCLRKHLIKIFMRLTITKCVAGSWVEQEILEQLTGRWWSWLCRIGVLCLCDDPVQLQCLANSSGLAGELLNQSTACVIQTSASGGKRARKACTIKLCRPAAHPTQSCPTVEQRGPWTAHVISCLSTSSSPQLSKAEGREAVSSDSLPWMTFCFVNSGWETQPFSPTQLSSCKAAESTATIEVIESSVGNWNFPSLLVLELTTPCTIPQLLWNFNQWVHCFAVETWCRCMAILFHTSWDICRCVETRRVTFFKKLSMICLAVVLTAFARHKPSDWCFQISKPPLPFTPS